MRLVWLSFLLAAWACSACAQHVSGSQSGQFISPTLPPQQLANMGALDKKGFGGVQPQNVGGALSLVSVRNNATGLASTDLTLDGWGQIVFNGTYGNANPGSLPTGTCSYPTPTHGYLVTLSNGVYTGTVCVSIVANTSYVRSHYVAPNYAPAGYTLTNPDSVTSFQLKTVLEDTSLPVDATVYMRDESGTTGRTPGLNPWFLNFETSGGSTSVARYNASIPGTAGGLSSYTYSDGSGQALVTDNGSSGTSLVWTTMTASTGTGLNGSHTYTIWGPGVDYNTTAACTNAGTGSGSCTLSKPLLSTFVAGESVVISGNITVASENATAGNDAYGNPLRGGGAQVGELSIQSGTDHHNPITVQNVTFYNNVAPLADTASFTGYINNGTDNVAGNIMTVTAVASGTLAVGQNVSGTPAAAVSGQKGQVFIVSDGHTVNTDCGGAQCTGTGGTGTYKVDTGNLTSITQTAGTSSVPISLMAGTYGSFGGLPNGGINSNPIFNNGGGWGLSFVNNRIEAGPNITDAQIAQNGLIGVYLNAGNIVGNSFNRGSTFITTNQAGYSQRTGGVAAACTGSQPNLTCRQTYVTSNVGINYQADFLDLGTNTADVDAESNLSMISNSNWAFIVPAAGDQFTINDTTASTSKTYTFTSNVTGGNNADGNVPVSANPVQNQINMACTINAAHGSYIQVAPFALTPSGSGPSGQTSFLCVDGVNLPAAATADPSVVATYDSLNSEAQYWMPLLPITPGHTITDTWFSKAFNNNIAVTNATDTVATLGQFVATYGSDLNVSSITSGQVVIGAVLTNVSGATVPANTRVLSYVPATAPGGTGHYTLSAAITCSGCTLKQSISSVKSLSQSTLHPDFMQPFGLNTTADVPITAKYNIAIRGQAPANINGPQGFTDNGAGNACCFVSTNQNNILVNSLQGAMTIQMYHNSSIARNLFVSDLAGNVFDASTTSTFNAILGLTMSSPNNRAYKALMQTVCSHTGSGGNAITSNITNSVAINCGTTGNTVTPAIQTTLNWIPSTEAPLTVAARYATMFPNYSSTINTGSASCGTTRLAIIACMAPARGQTFTADLSTSCVLTTATSLPVNTHVNGPGLPDPGAGGNDNHVTTAGGVGPYSLATTGCTTQTAQTYSTGAENVDGTYSGPLLPANDFGEVCWNDGSVWDKTQHCTAAN